MYISVIPKSERTSGEEEGNENWWDNTYENQFKGIPLKRYSIVGFTMRALNLDRKRDNDFSFVLHRQIKALAGGK